MRLSPGSQAYCCWHASCMSTGYLSPPVVTQLQPDHPPSDVALSTVALTARLVLQNPTTSIPPIENGVAATAPSVRNNDATDKTSSRRRSDLTQQLLVVLELSARETPGDPRWRAVADPPHAPSAPGQSGLHDENATPQRTPGSNSRSFDPKRRWWAASSVRPGSCGPFRALAPSIAQGFCNPDRHGSVGVGSGLERKGRHCPSLGTRSTPMRSQARQCPPTSAKLTPPCPPSDLSIGPVGR